MNRNFFVIFVNMIYYSFIFDINDITDKKSRQIEFIIIIVQIHDKKIAKILLLLINVNENDMNVALPNEHRISLEEC